MVLGDDELRLADILDFHPAGILANLGTRPDGDHDLGAAIEDVSTGSVAALIAGVDPDLKLPESSLRYAR